jgi:polyisoprenoid-binding protein YceI
MDSASSTAREAIQASVTATATAPGRWEADVDPSDLRFKLRHLIVAEITGHLQRWRASVELDPADPTRSIVEAVLDPASIDTGEPERDDQVRSAEFLDVIRFPEIRFRSRQIEPGAGPNLFTVVGELTIRDTTRDVTLELEDLGRGDLPRAPGTGRARAFQVRGLFNRQEFGLHWNQDLATRGLILSDTVEVTVSLTFRPVLAAPAPSTSTGSDEHRAGAAH